MIIGIINLKKEVGMILYDVVFKFWKILYIKKIGYGGIFDLDVVGVLLIVVGKVICVIEYMIESGKIYEGEIILGYVISIEDFSGEVILRILLI